MSTSNKRALIVDDSKVARVLLHRMLDKYELIVDSLSSAEEALDYLKSTKPDVIFMDHMMPGMDGFAAVKFLKANPDTASIPIIMYTSRESDVYAGRARALGAFDVLPKSAQPVELHKMLQRLNLLDEVSSEAAVATEEDMSDDLEIGQVHDEQLDSIAKTAASSVTVDKVKNIIRNLFNDQRDSLKNDMLLYGEQLAYKVNREYADEHKLVIDFFAAQNEQYRSPLRYFLSGLKYAVFALVVITGTVWLINNDNYKRMLNLDSALSTAYDPETAVVRMKDVVAENLRLGGVVKENQEQIRQVRSVFHDVLQTDFIKASHFERDASPLNKRNLEKISIIMEYLKQSRFAGKLVLTMQFGQFCWVRNPMDELIIADKTLPATQCQFLDPLLAEKSMNGVVQEVENSAEWAKLKIEIELQSDERLHIELAEPAYRLYEVSEIERVDLQTAGEWNSFATEKQRVVLDIQATK